MFAEELITNALDHKWDDTAATRDYLRWVALDIVRWSEGKSFVFVDEHDDRYERLLEDPGWRNADRWRTGSRFSAGTNQDVGVDFRALAEQLRAELSRKEVQS
jgi:long-subunit fatty acid transport protein